MSDTYVTDIPKRTRTGRLIKPYSHPERLLTLYRFMESYFRKYQRHISNRELVMAGFAGSTSVVRYYFDQMIRLDMLELQKITKPDGTQYTPARGIRLLPLSQAHKTVKDLVAAEAKPTKEKSHE